MLEGLRIDRRLKDQLEIVVRDFLSDSRFKAMYYQPLHIPQQKARVLPSKNKISIFFQKSMAFPSHPPNLNFHTI